MLDPAIASVVIPLFDRPGTGVPMLLKDAGQEIAGTSHWVGVAALRDAGSTSPHTTPLVGAFRVQHPGVTIRLAHPEGTGELVELVRSGDSDAIPHPHQLREHLGPWNHRDAASPRRRHLGVVRPDRRGHDHDVGVDDVRGRMPRRDPDAEAKREERGQRTSHKADGEQSGGDAEPAEAETAHRS